MDNKQDILSLLRQVQAGSVSPDEALLQLKEAPFEDLGYAKVDFHRPVRQGAAEVIYGQSKTPEQIIGILTAMGQRGCRNVLVTRLSPESARPAGVRGGRPHRRGPGQPGHPAVRCGGGGTAPSAP